MKYFLVITVFALGLSANYFGITYTKDTTLDSGRTVPFIHTMIYPYSGKFVANMGKQHDSGKLLDVKEFYSVHKGNKEDLLKTLEAIEFSSAKSKGKGYKSKHKLKKMGDHLFVLKSAPYYSELEGIYLQPITKTVVNIAGKPTDWDRELGLEAEIVPLSKPYGIWEGSSFSGMVKASGIPVPFAMIEVEYLNSEIDMKNNKMGKAKTNANHQSFKTIELKANERGEFTFHLPLAGWWGFTAKHVGLNKKYNGKELSIEGTIWVQVEKVK